MKMLILEGPDNLGKSTAAEKLRIIFETSGFKVFSIRIPDRGDWSKDMGAYVMGQSEAIPIERQYLIFTNGLMQYAQIPKDTDIVICDRHYVVSSLVYFRDGSDSANMYRKAVQESVLMLAHYLGIDYTACIMLVGDQPFIIPDEAEHFEKGKWEDIRDRYNRLKYSGDLPACNIEVCAIDAFEAKEKVVPMIAGLFGYALKYGKLPSPLAEGIPDNM
jgi:thymidylate kinase